MAAKSDEDKVWGVTVVGDNERPEHDQIIVTRYDAPRFTLELRVPSIRHAGEKQGQLGYRALRDAVDSLQQAIESKSLPGLS
ncbi:MAG: hypothetical protein P8Y82_04655 [Methyloceanibacter sp.]